MLLNWPIHGVVGRYSQTRFPEKNLDELARILIQAEAGTRNSSRDAQAQRRNVRRRLGNEKVWQLIAEYEQGDKTIVLMERYGLSKTAVLKLLQDYDVTMRRRPARARARHLYESGASFAKLAEQVSASSETTRLALITAGVQVRPRGGRRSKPLAPVPHPASAIFPD